MECRECAGAGLVQDGTGYSNSEGGEEWTVVACPACSGWHGLQPPQPVDDTPEESDLATARAEVERLRLRTAWADGTESELVRLRDDNARLREGLRTYGDHRWKCSISRMIRSPEAATGLEVCDCGWDDTRRTLICRAEKQARRPPRAR